MLNLLAFVLTFIASLRTNLILEEHDQALMDALQFINPLGLVVLVSVFVSICFSCFIQDSLLILAYL
jgi:hypothetical protein